MNPNHNRFQRIRVWLAIAGVSLGLLSCDTEGNIDPVNESYFVRFFGDEGRQEGVDLLVNEADQSVVLLGTTTTADGAVRLFLVKADWNGNMIWRRKLGGRFELARDIEFANDGGYIILSQSRDESSPDNSDNVKLLRVSTDGSPLDSVVYGSGSDLKGLEFFGVDMPETVTPTGDGYIVSGSVQKDQFKFANTVSEVAYFKLKFSSDLVRDEDFTALSSISRRARGVKAFRTNDSTIYLMGSDDQMQDAIGSNINFKVMPFGYEGGGGFESSSNSHTVDFFVGIDEDGHDETLTAVCPSFGDGFFLVGEHVDPAGRRDIYTGLVANQNGALVKASEGSILPIPLNGTRKITPTSVCQTKMGGQGYVIVGSEGEEGSRNIWMTKVSDPGGQVLWSTLLGAGDRNDDHAGAVAELPNGKIVAVGTVNLGVNNFKMGFFKLNSYGRFEK